MAPFHGWDSTVSRVQSYFEETKGIIIFPYDDEEIILFASMEKKCLITIHWEKKLPDLTYFKFLSEWNFKGIYIDYGMAGSNILNR